MLDAVRKLLLKRAANYAKRRRSSGVRTWCKVHGVAAPHASEFMNGIRGPAPDLLEALGLEWRVMPKRPR